ncbi:hypothetical protein SDJN03_29850, partial [Cucurbita argyrosperma subsp. sororia]
MDLHYAMSLQWPLTNKWLPRWPLTACQVDSNVMICQNYSFMNPEDLHLLRDGPCRIPPSSCIGMIESSPFFELTTNDSTFFTSCAPHITPPSFFSLSLNDWFEVNSSPKILRVSRLG